MMFRLRTTPCTGKRRFPVGGPFQICEPANDEIMSHPVLLTDGRVCEDLNPILDGVRPLGHAVGGAEDQEGEEDDHNKEAWAP